MYNVWKFFLTNGLAALASCIVSFMILVISHCCALGLFSIVIAPLIGGFLASCMVLFFLEDGGVADLVQAFWHTLLLGITISLIVTVGFVYTISQHYLFF
ncbi:MAG: hypothetical protein D3908_01920 [Candidatus Electrothrix sp. AUS4]|nr:hypothetical protein [Candidatus Electrothrix sp. AUS4]